MHERTFKEVLLVYMWHNIIVITILTTEKSCCSLYRIGRRACKYWGNESMSTRDWRKLKKGQNYGRSKWALEKEVKKSEPTISPRYTVWQLNIYSSRHCHRIEWLIIELTWLYMASTISFRLVKCWMIL